MTVAILVVTVEGTHTSQCTLAIVCTIHFGAFKSLTLVARLKMFPVSVFDRHHHIHTWVKDSMLNLGSVG